MAEAPGLDVELIAVTPGQVQTPGSLEAPRKRAPFWLLFRGPHTPVLPQRIYTLTHSRLGTFDLFLVPIGPDPHGMRYEAVFG